MQDFVKEKIKLTDRQLLDQFTNGVGDSFHAYKKNSSINRTFVNCNFKDKPSKVDDERIKKIIEEERLRIKNKGKKSMSKIAAGEKNFWRRNKLKKRNQSVSVTQAADQSGIIVHDEDHYDR